MSTSKKNKIKQRNKKLQKKDREGKRSAVTKSQLRQARNLLLREGDSLKGRIPDVDAVTSELQRLAKIPWNKPEKIQELKVLTGLTILRPGTLVNDADPCANVWALEAFLRRVVDGLARQDAQAPYEEREIGIPAALLLGLRVMTRNSKIGTRRDLVAPHRRVDAETVRRSHARELCRVVALEVVRREIEFLRAIPEFRVGGRPLPSVPTAIPRRTPPR